MIIKSIPSGNYTKLPNALLQDRRLQLDTKGLLVDLLSRPPGWEVKPGVVMQQHSVGWKRLRRMFDEAQAAGYMARSAEQSHKDDGSWGSFVYIVGTDPAAVRAEVERQMANVAFVPQSRLAPTSEAHAPEADAIDKRKTDTNNTQLQTERAESQFADAALEATKEEGLAEKRMVVGGDPTPHRTAYSTRRVTDWKAPCRKIGLTANQSRAAADAARRSQRDRDSEIGIERPEVIQARVADRLGPNGWAILQSITPGELDQLTAMERRGWLTETKLAELRLRSA